MKTNILLHYANKLAEQGVSFFPIDIKKIPLVKFAYLSERNTTKEDIANWFSYLSSKITGFAILTGRINNLTVIDLDIDSSTGNLPNNPAITYGDIAHTRCVKTPSGGVHGHFNYCEDIISKNDLFNHIDIKSGNNQYTVLPFSYCYSSHSSSYGYYNYIDNNPKQDVPQHIKELIVKKQGRQDIKNDDFSIKYREIISQVSKKLPEDYAKETTVYGAGKRHDYLRKVSFSSFFNTDESEWKTRVVPVIRDIGKRRCNPPKTDKEINTMIVSTTNKVKEIREKAFNTLKPLGVEIPKEKKLKTETPLKIRTNEEIRNIELKKDPFILAPFIPEKAITCISAPTGQGKSLLVYMFSHHIALGKYFLNKYKAKKAKVLIIDQEMDSDIIADRYRSIVKDAPVDIVFEQNFKIDKDEQREELINIIKKNNYGVVVFDTLITIHKQDENTSEGMSLINDYFKEIIDKTGITIVFTHHLNKGETYNNNSVRGSGEIIAKASSHIALVSKPLEVEGKYTLKMSLSHKKNRRVETFNNIDILVTTDISTRDTIWEYCGKTETNVRKRFKTDVLEYLVKHKGQTFKFKDIDEVILSCRGREKREGLKELVMEGKISSNCNNPNIRTNYDYWFDDSNMKQMNIKSVGDIIDDFKN